MEIYRENIPSTRSLISSSSPLTKQRLIWILSPSPTHGYRLWIQSRCECLLRLQNNNNNNDDNNNDDNNDDNDGDNNNDGDNYDGISFFHFKI